MKPSEIIAGRTYASRNPKIRHRCAISVYIPSVLGNWERVVDYQDVDGETRTILLSTFAAWADREVK